MHNRQLRTLNVPKTKQLDGLQMLNEDISPHELVIGRKFIRESKARAASKHG
jgi:hypothetical protein